MEDIRSGNMYVSNMQEEIKTAIVHLKGRPKNKRILRQIKDGEDFLTMIGKQPYCSCKKVSELKSVISERRNALKKKKERLESVKEGYQFDLFTKTDELSESEIKQKKKELAELDDRIRWLHKCLGMASNRNYFN